MIPEDLKDYRADDGFQLIDSENAGTVLFVLLTVAAFVEWVLR